MGLSRVKWDFWHKAGIERIKSLGGLLEDLVNKVKIATEYYKPERSITNE